MDGKLLEFPLCCLAFGDTKEERLEHIISYSVVEYSIKIEKGVRQRVALLEDSAPYDFDSEVESHRKLLLASDELSLKLGSINYNFKRHSTLSKFIEDYQVKYGKDAYCRVGKSLCFEVKDGRFDYKLFTVLCAIQSNIGKKKKFFRITKRNIRYRMHGYKTQKIALAESLSPDLLLTDRQIGRRVDLLHAKKFFSKFTYAQRQTFYSTRLNDDELKQAVFDSKVYWAKKKAGNDDREYSEKIKSQLKLIRYKKGKLCEVKVS